jgi:hypothetical protein
MFSSVGSSNIPTSTIDDPQQEEDDEIYSDFDKEDLVTDFKVNQKIKIKLIIVEISHTKKEQNIRKFLSPLATTFGKNPQFGMFHSALGNKFKKLKFQVVGPWYLGLDFFSKNRMVKQSIVHPKEDILHCCHFSS